MWKCGSQNGGESNWPPASSVSCAGASRPGVTSTMRPPCTATDMSVRPSGRLAWVISRSSIVVHLGGGVSSAPEDTPRSGELFGAEDAVAGVAQARQDVAVFVELAVDGRRVDRHVGVGFLQRGQ